MVNSGRSAGNPPSSSVRVINENEFEEIFNYFKGKGVTDEFRQVYEQVLTTVGNAHRRNKQQNETLQNEMSKIDEAMKKVDTEVSELEKSKKSLKERI